MSDPIVMATGILVAGLLVWLGYRMGGSTLPAELEEAAKLEKSDPARSEFLADRYFTREAARDEAERAQLWERAPTDLAAAEELRRRIQGDLETDAEIREEFRKTGNEAFLRTLEQAQRDSRDQIAKLDVLIQRLQSGQAAPPN